MLADWHAGKLTFSIAKSNNISITVCKTDFFRVEGVYRVENEFGSEGKAGNGRDISCTE
jgi:hypothetical protein